MSYCVPNLLRGHYEETVKLSEIILNNKNVKVLCFYLLRDIFPLLKRTFHNTQQVPFYCPHFQ